jgi:hypothetical protein
VCSDYLYKFHVKYFLVQQELKDILSEIETGLYVKRVSGSSVGITTGYGLDGPGIESKEPQYLLAMFIDRSTRFIFTY